MDDFFLWFGAANVMAVVISVVGGAIVAWVAAYKGAKAGGEIAKQAAVEGVHKAIELDCI